MKQSKSFQDCLGSYFDVFGSEQCSDFPVLELGTIDSENPSLQPKK